MENTNRGIYEVRSYDGTITKQYSNYKNAYIYCNKLIAKHVWCGIYELICDKNADGTDNLDTLRWYQVIGY